MEIKGSRKITSGGTPGAKRQKAGKTDNPAVAENPDAKGELLLEIAAKTFLEEGFAGASVGEIARRANASKETIYSRYESKERLFEAVMRRLVGRFSGQLEATMAPQDPPEKVLAAFGKKIMDRILSNEGIALQNIAYMEAKRFPGIAKIFLELGPQRAMLSLGRYLEAQVERKQLRALDGETAAGHFLGILTFDLMMRRSAGVVKRPSAQENEQRIKTAVAVFLRAYSP